LDEQGNPFSQAPCDPDQRKPKPQLHPSSAAMFFENQIKARLSGTGNRVGTDKGTWRLFLTPCVANKAFRRGRATTSKIYCGVIGIQKTKQACEFAMLTGKPVLSSIQQLLYVSVTARLSISKTGIF
jgi:hypothetical protein